MNRNATGFLAAGAVLSALAASPGLPPSNSAPAPESPPSQSSPGDRDLRLAAIEERLPDQDFAHRARRDSARRLARVFLDVCREGKDGLDPEPAESEPLPDGVEAAGSCPEMQGDLWANQEFPGDEPAACWLRRREPAIHTNCHLQARNFVLALVPDPVHTRLALLFDRSVEVIQEASQDRGFQFVQAQIPWDPKNHPESQDIASRLHAKAYTSAQGEFPGLLAFRRGADATKDDREYLFVFLVGESPTGGIDKQQFLNAMDWIRHLVGERVSQATQLGAASPPDLWILGPTFSGSLASLDQLLRCPRQGGACYGRSLVFSGGVTSREAKQRFLDRQASFAANLASFQWSDEETIKRFRRLLVGPGHPRREVKGPGEDEWIAVLSEDETEYGAGRDLDACPECFYLHYPREISRLRAAYQGLDITEINAQARSIPRAVLPSNLEISGEDDDTVSAFSKQTTLSQEAVLLGIVSELRKHAVQFVLLRATDPVDLLFLSRYLAAAYPRGRIVTLGADLLFRREVENSQLHGVMALSTYSLAPTANHGFAIHSEGIPERLFPSSSDAATYNALRALLASETASYPPSHGRYALPSDLLLYQYGWHEAWMNRCQDDLTPELYNTPPVHLLALGRDEYWPLARLGKGDLNELPLVTRAQVSRRSLSVTTPISWVAVEMIALLLALGFAAALWCSSLRSPSQLFASLAPAIADERVALIAFADLVLASIVALLAFPLLDFRDWDINWRWALLAVLAVALLAAVVPVLDLRDRIRLLERPWRSHRSHLTSWSFPVLAGAVIGLLTLSIAVPSLFDTSTDGVGRFQILRSLQLTSGLSPLLPMLLLLAAWLWWAYHICAGMALLDPRNPRLPQGVAAERCAAVAESMTEGETVRNYVVKELRDALHPNEGSLDHALRHYGLPGVLSALPLLLLAGSAQQAAHSMMALEIRRFAPALVVLFWLTLAGILGTTMRLWEIWIKTRRLLVSLDSLPLRAGLKRLQGFSWKPLWRLGLLSMAEFQRVLARINEARAIATKGLPGLRGEDAEDRSTQLRGQWTDILNLKHPYRKDWRERREKEVRLINDYAMVQSDIADAAGKALDHLDRYWAKAEESRREGESQEDLVARACERFVCLVYVSFLLVVLVRLRTLILAAGGMYILVVMAVTAYPFQPRAAIGALLAMLLIYVTAVVILVLAQLHRDATLSHLTNTKPGELGGDFWMRATSFAALPLLTFLASQFPQVNRLLYAWLEPALRALNK